jgi:Zn finger protein HypA/HybF involved in hydrogenase expression
MILAVIIFFLSLIVIAMFTVLDEEDDNYECWNCHEHLDNYTDHAYCPHCLESL